MGHEQQVQYKFADLLDISADLNYEDGDFRRMTENSLKPDNFVN